MKRLSKFAALFTAITLTFTGCNAPDESAPKSGVALLQTAEPVPTAESAERETSAPEAEETKETAKSAEAAPTEGSADSEPEFVTYSEPNEGHIFVDFDYIEDAEGITDSAEADEWYDRALEFLRNTEEYKAFEEYVRSEDFDADQFADYVDENGDPASIFERAFIDDFDNNGENEAFITFSFLHTYSYEDRQYIEIRYFTVYVGTNNIQVCEIYSGNTSSSEIFQYDIIDYGLCKQLVIHTGGFGFEQTGAIFGVDNDTPINLFSIRAWYDKADCFLSAVGWQSAGCLMYYDTAAKEYRAIRGKEMDINDILAMDTEGVIKRFREDNIEYTEEVTVTFIGGKYYVLSHRFMDIGTPFTYENGKFVEQRDCHVRNCHIDMTSVEDIDYDAAVASMLTPAQAREKAKNGYITYLQPDEGHVFVDFDYIGNAEGITDPKQTGEWLDRALEALEESEYYKALADFDPSKDTYDFKPEEYLNEDGALEPRFERAFIEDLDGDGGEEAFVILTMPAVPYSICWKIRYFLIYIGSSNTKLFECLPEIYGYNILDYGLCKQLIIAMGGLGVETGSTIYGVNDGVPEILYSFRGGYEKVDCFLSGFGHQGGGDFMYYDTAAKEYRAIDGKEMTFEEAFAMDTSGSLSEEKRRNFVEGKMLDTEVVVIGEKYYCFDYGLFGIGEPYTYENGVFTECEYGTVRISRGWTYNINHIEDINYDEAVASMLTPAQAALL